MSDVAAPTPATPAAPAPERPNGSGLRQVLDDLLSVNPVVLKELRGRMRGARAFVVLTVYLLLLSAFVIFLYYLYSASTASAFSASQRGLVGKFVFGGVVGIELLLVCFIAPAFTVGAISGERERQTFDLLRTTLLPARSLVLGKLGSALVYIFLLLFAALPLQSLAFLLGGVALEELVIATLLLVACAFLFSAAGVYFSSLMRRTLGATVLTFGFVLISLLALPLLLIPLLVFSSAFSLMGSPSVVVQAILLYTGLLLSATNPVATMIISEIMIVDQTTGLWFVTLPLSDPATGVVGLTAYIPSPWMLFTVFAMALGAVFVLLAMLNVSRRER
mgnify:CR=1 FL=1